MRCQSIRRLLAGVAFGLAGLIGSAQADIIDFESLPADSLFFSGSTFDQATFYQFTQNGDFGASATAASFAVAIPPSGNATQFYAALNDSSVSFQRTDGRWFSMDGFDAAFLAPFPQDEGTSAGSIVVTATDASGGTHIASFDLGTAAGDGSYAFLTFGDLFVGSSNLLSVTFMACVYDGASCLNPGFNAAQFGLDNVRITPVPEPSAIALMLLALLLVGYFARLNTRRS